jgi:isochorismate pyruvate lyase
VVRVSGFGEPALGALRREIDDIDRALVALIAKRFDCVQRVIEVKRRENIPALIEARVEQVLQQVRGQADQAGVPPALPEAIWRTMMDWVIDYESDCLATSEPSRPRPAGVRHAEDPGSLS